MDVTDAGRASGSDRFDYFWQQQGEWVEEPHQRRGGESGLQRLGHESGQPL